MKFKLNLRFRGGSPLHEMFFFIFQGGVEALEGRFMPCIRNPHCVNRTPIVDPLGSVFLKIPFCNILK